jgi:hypothetical protein
MTGYQTAEADEQKGGDGIDNGKPKEGRLVGMIHGSKRTTAADFPRSGRGERL